MGYDPKWYQNVPTLIQEIHKLYERVVQKRPESTLLATTAKRIVEHRGWSASTFEHDLEATLQRLGFLYLPKILEPGPMFIFPIQDVARGTAVRAQTKPLDGSTLFGQGKYLWVGEKTQSPSWLGDDPQTIKNILETQKVVLVEGPFDLLAARLVAPADLPILCPLTKRIGGKHEQYLNILGVRRLLLMFDNERPKGGHDIGAGNLSMGLLEKEIKSMKVEILKCPSDDPSECLKTVLKAGRLKKLLQTL